EAITIAYSIRVRPRYNGIQFLQAMLVVLDLGIKLRLSMVENRGLQGPIWIIAGVRERLSICLSAQTRKFGLKAVQLPL
ncbi:hypothetical protein ABTN93_18795, partial [Acinetobacter baumannii]